MPCYTATIKFCVYLTALQLETMMIKECNKNDLYIPVSLFTMYQIELNLSGLNIDMELKKELSLLDVFSIASGVMISAGLFILPGIAYEKAGPGIVVSYFLAGIFAAAGMLSQAELASAMPKAGGTYFYVTRTMGPAVGTMYGLITWLALSLKSAFALTGIGIFSAMITDVNPIIILIPICIFFVAVNIVGIDIAGRIQTILVLAIFSVLIYYSGRGFPEISVRHFEPFAPHGIDAIFATSGFVFVCYGGLLKVASIAEEVRNPGRTIPKGMILALLAVAVLYISVISVTVGVLEPFALANSLTPISDAAKLFLGRTGYIAVSIAAVLAFITAANSGIMSASRYPFALARDKMLPSVLTRVNRKFNTPHISIILTGIVIIGILFLKLDVLVKAASSVLILTYIFSCFSLIILRESKIHNYQPQFHSPLYPWLQIFGIAGFVFMLATMGTKILIADIIMIAIGLFVYWFYGRIRASKEFALLHLIERITAKEITSYSLENELKEVIRERDDILKDRFDHLIEQATIIDIEDDMTMEEFFHLAAEKMSSHLDVDTEFLYNLFIEREKESTTALTPFLAVPHIIVPGEHHFDILLARSKKGIRFSDEAPNIHAVFVLVGTKDERAFHLRALAAIAQIIQDSEFERKWLSARSEEELRDVVLLGKRLRK